MDIIILQFKMRPVKKRRAIQQIFILISTYSLLVMLFFLSSFELLANTEQKKTNSLLITHLEHPALQPFIELIKTVYQEELGIKFQLQAVPAQRGLLMLNSGLTDADVVRANFNASTFENIIVIEPEITIGELLLVCKLNVLCSADVLSDPSESIMSNIGAKQLISELGVKATILLNENLSDSLEMMRKREVNYAFYGSTKAFKKELEKEFNVLSFQDIKLNHVINKRHSDLVPKLSKAIANRKVEFFPDHTN